MDRASNRESRGRDRRLGRRGPRHRAGVCRPGCRDRAPGAGDRGADRDPARRGGTRGSRADAADRRRRPATGRGSGRSRGRPVRPDRRLGQQRHGDGPVAREGDDPRRVPPRDRGDLSRGRARNARRAPADAAARPRPDHPGGLGAGIPGDPPAVGLLRRQARAARVHRFAQERAHSRRQPHPNHHGPHAGPEHPAVPMGAQPHASQGTADPPHFSAGSGGARHRLCGRSLPPRVLRRLPDGEGDRRQQVPARLRRPGRGARDCYEGQMYDGPEDPERGDNLWRPRPGDHGAHGVFDDRARGRSLQLWASLNRGRLALAGALLGGTIAAGILGSRRRQAPSGRLPAHEPRVRAGPGNRRGPSIACDLSGCAPAELVETT